MTAPRDDTPPVSGHAVPPKARRFKPLTAAERVDLLIDLGRVVRGTLELTVSLPKLAGLLVGCMADWCVIDLFDNARLERMAVAHVDQRKQARASQLLGWWSLDEAPWGPTGVARQGHFVHLPDVEDPTLLGPRRNPALLAVVDELGLGAVLSVPMKAGDRVVGVVTLVRARPAQPFTAMEVSTTRIMANRVAEAIGQGLLYRDSQLAGRSKDEFMAMLGHELRNPVAAISHAVRVLERIGAPDETAARFRAIIARQADHLARLVDDLLDVARVSSGKIVLRREPVDLRATAEHVLALRADPAENRHEIVLDAEPVVVSADLTRVEQILTNLLENSIKYTPAGGRIEVRVRRKADTAILAVQDTGSGITADILPRVFDLFVQGEPRGDGTRSGLGLGLTLVRRLAELHGGTVHASSAGPGKGTLIEVALPLASTAGGPTSTARAIPASGTRRVLIVEDNADARDALAALLAGEGHQVDAVASGFEGLEHARHLCPEIALVDIGLPGMDGYAVARQLRALSGDGIMLIALTGYGQPADRRRALDAGFDVHLVKPVSPEDLARIFALRDNRAAAS